MRGVILKNIPNPGLLLKLLPLLMLMVPGKILNADERDFNITVRNQTQTASNRLEFDVYIIDTDRDQDFDYATSQLGFLINSRIYTGGYLSVTYDNRNSGLRSAQQFTAKPKVVSNLEDYPDKTLIIQEGVNVNWYGTGTVISKTSPGTLMTHFIITSSVDFTINSTPDIVFTGSTVPSQLYPTRVAAYISRIRSYIDVIPGVNAIVYDNPVLNPMDPPEVFVVTGSGSYCEGGEGIPVGLTGSETGVRYTLYRNDVPLDPPVDGTGSEISFGNQTEGTYTVIGRNEVGITKMKGSAIIKENPLPAVPRITVDCTLGAGNAVVILTGLQTDDLEYRLDDGEYQTEPVFSGVDNGVHAVTVRNSFGCIVTTPPFTVECGCANPPELTLAANSGSICGTSIVTVNGNKFGGGATGVTITENGNGNVIPVSTSTSPFDFVYLPAESDIGKTIIITVTTDNPAGPPCEPASDTYILTVAPIPSAPVIGTITHPTCTVPTGSVILSGLPSPGTWELIRNPGNFIVSGSGPGTVVTGLNPGTYTFSVKNPAGCISGPSSSVVIKEQPGVPAAPIIGAITQPTCDVATGSVILNGLPSSGKWVITGMPGPITKVGEGITTTITGIVAGTYTFTVTNESGCISPPSASVVIQPQPPVPTPPVPGTITPPTCTVSIGSVVLSGLPATGTWTLTRYPGTINTTGTGTSTTISGLSSGTYNFTVTNSFGCTSSLSGNVIIPVQPQTPTPPVIGQITQPTLTVPTGSVALSGLPASGTWRLTRNPGNVTVTGTGTTRTIAGIAPGTYTFTVTNAAGCTSAPSASVVIDLQPKPPTLVINDPPTICSTQTTDLTRPEITEGSDPNLIFTYWYDDEAKDPLINPELASEGTYYIKATTSSGYSTVKPVIVLADDMPSADSGPDITLGFAFETGLNAALPEFGNGMWSVLSGGGRISDEYDPNATVSQLALGQNILLWSVTNGVCPPAYDTLIITVRDFTVPSLLTPNMDGRNDFFIIMGLETLGKSELVIFDRRGAKVYWNSNYNNDWNGVDHKGRLLPDDTYFYIVRSEKGQSLNGFIVLRR